MIKIGVLFINLMLCVQLHAQNTQTAYVALSCGLFKNNQGDIVYKSEQIIDEEGGRATIYIDWLYMDNTIDTLDAGTEKLKTVVDTASFKFLNNCFWKDKNHVYIFTPTSFGGSLSILDVAKPKTFTALGQSRYAKDNDHVYYFYDIIEGADLKTFTLIENDSAIEALAMDKNYFYGNGLRLDASIVKKYGLIKFRNKK
jgi:hypothetical protein